MRILNVYNISVRPVPEFLCYKGNVLTDRVDNRIISLQPISVYLPSVIIDIELRLEEGKLLTNTAGITIANIHFKFREPSQNFFLYVSNLIFVGIINAEQMSPCKIKRGT